MGPGQRVWLICASRFIITWHWEWLDTGSESSFLFYH